MSGMFLVHAVAAKATPLDVSTLSVADGALLSLIVDGDLQAVVTELPIAAGEKLLASPESATETALSHHACLTALATTHDIVPVRLGAAYASENDVKRMLSDGRDRFLAALERIAGAAEFAVKLTIARTARQPDAAESEASDGRSFLQRRAMQAQAQRTRTERLRQAAASALDALSR
ncbi:MAG: GvpL/GvpF family gas vesicle protein, partial [Beijerinckiaceae bacterium]